MTRTWKRRSLLPTTRRWDVLDLFCDRESVPLICAADQNLEEKVVVVVCVVLHIKFDSRWDQGAFSLILIALIKRYLSPIPVTVLDDSRKEVTARWSRRRRALRVVALGFGVSWRHLALLNAGSNSHRIFFPHGIFFLKSYSFVIARRIGGEITNYRESLLTNQSTPDDTGGF